MYTCMYVYIKCWKLRTEKLENERVESEISCLSVENDTGFFNISLYGNKHNNILQEKALKIGNLVLEIRKAFS